MIGQIGSGQGHPVFYHGPRKCPAEDEILPSIVDTTRNSAFLLASRCVAQPAEEPYATVCENTATYYWLLQIRNLHMIRSDLMKIIM